MAGVELLELSTAFAVWLLTYLLHSTLWIAGTLAAVRFGPATLRRERTADVLWKTALVAAFATATWQSSGRPHSFTGTIDVPAPIVLAERVHQTSYVVTSVGTFGPARFEFVDRVSTPQAFLVPPRLLWPSLLFAFWLVGAGVALTRLFVTRTRFRRLLAFRRQLSRTEIESMLGNGLASAAPTGLTVSISDELPFPAVIGRREIGLPSRLLSEMTAEEIRGVAAHELAHIVRHDAAWLLVFDVVRAFFFMQPLHRIGFRAFQENSELVCDGWAARHTGQPRTLARTIVAVAEWLVAGAPTAYAPGIVGGRSTIERRVARLLEPLAESRERPVVAVACAAMLVLGTAALPRVVASPPRLSPESLGQLRPVYETMARGPRHRAFGESGMRRSA